jgi:hypothetical protein
MSSIIIYESKEVKPKGLNKADIINQDKLLNYFFEGDYEKLSVLDNIKLNHNKEKISLLYPGSGADVFVPLIYLNKLFPNVKKAKLIFVDSEDNLGLIKTVLDDVGISFKGRKNKIKFYWNKQLIELKFLPERIETHLQKGKTFDIYFEKAFRLMRDNIHNYEDQVVSLLKEGGVLISDTGFLNKELNYLEVPKNLSSYEEMVLGIKKKKE